MDQSAGAGCEYVDLLMSVGEDLEEMGAQKCDPLGVPGAGGGGRIRLFRRGLRLAIQVAP